MKPGDILLSEKLGLVKKELGERTAELGQRYDHDIRQIRAKDAYDRAQEKFLDQKDYSVEKFWSEEPEKSFEELYVEEVEGNG